MKPFSLSTALPLLAGAVIYLGFASPVKASQTELASAKILLSQQAPQSAYEQLRAVELEYSGIPEFDYWLGVAALRAGESSHALMALDRAILRQPNHAGARLERVAALVQLGQYVTAERDIAQLQALSPPSDAQAAITRLQASINQARQAQSAPKHRGLLGVEIGYDSNPQRFPNEIALDPLHPELRRQAERLIESGWEPEDGSASLEERLFSRDASAYQRLQGSYQGTVPIDARSRWRIGTTGQAQRYTKESAQEYDLTLAQAQLGYQRDLAPQRTVTLKGSALLGWSGNNQHHLLTRWGSGVDLSHPIGLDSDLTWQLDAQHNRFNAADNDYDAASLGVQLETSYTALRARWNAQLEREWASEHRDGGDLISLLLGTLVDYPLGDHHLIRASLNHRTRTYQEQGFAPYNDFSATTRRDRIWQARLAWLHQFDNNLLLEASSEAEYRRSTIDFFDTRRYQAQLALRYLF
ncbi:tetratricopeptide repeat protein [Vreelandella sp. EE22]